MSCGWPVKRSPVISFAGIAGTNSPAALARSWNAHTCRSTNGYSRSILMTSAKKGMSAHQLFRNLGFGSYRTAWFLEHRIREAMTDRDPPKPFGGKDKTVEVDETYIGRLEGVPKPRAALHIRTWCLPSSSAAAAPEASISTAFRLQI